MQRMEKGKIAQGKKKGIFLLTLCVAWILVLTGCGGSKLSEEFEEESVKERAMEAVGYFNEKDYQAIIDMGNEEMRNGITAEDFRAASDPYLDKCGEFKEISKTVVLGNTDQKTGENYGGVVMVGKYESGQIQFTIAFNEQMELVQFIIR